MYIFKYCLANISMSIFAKIDIKWVKEIWKENFLLCQVVTRSLNHLCVCFIVGECSGIVCNTGYQKNIKTNANAH